MQTPLKVLNVDTYQVQRIAVPSTESAKISYLVGVEVHLVDGRVEAEVPTSVALNLPCAISKCRTSGGRCTHILDAMLLPWHGSRVYQDVPGSPDGRCQTWSADRGCS